MSTPIIFVTVEDSTPLKGRMRAAYRRARREALQAAAEYWHQRELPRAFTPGNESRLDLEPRNQVYVDEIKKLTGVGQGRFVLNTLTGRSKRFMLAFGRITGTADRVTIRMQAPQYFTHPFEGTYVDPRTGEQKSSSGQPDKPAEVTQTTPDQRERLRRVMERRMDKSLRDPEPTRSRKLRG